MLIALLLSGLSISAAAEAVGAVRARGHELRNRLGLGGPAALPDLRARVQWAAERWPTGIRLAAHVATLGGGQQWGWYAADESGLRVPEPGIRLPRAEPYIGWVARELERGVRVLEDLPWAAAIRIHLGAVGGDWGEGEEGFAGWAETAAFDWPRTAWSPTQEEVGDWVRHVNEGMGPPRWTENLDGPVAVLMEIGPTGGEIPRRWTGVLGLDRETYDLSPFNVEFYAPSDTTPTVSLSEVLDYAVEQILDWAEQTNTDLGPLRWTEAVAAAETWHTALGLTLGFGLPIPVYPGDTVAHTWPDGATLVDLHSKRGLTAEGVSMGHCVGGYWAQVREGQTRIWSYRDPAGIPRATFETDMGGGELKQLRGPKDGAIQEPPVRVRLLEAALDVVAGENLFARSVSWRRAFGLGAVMTEAALAEAREALEAPQKKIRSLAKRLDAMESVDVARGEVVDALLPLVRQVVVTIFQMFPAGMVTTPGVKIEALYQDVYRPIDRTTFALGREPDEWRIAVVRPWTDYAGHKEALLEMDFTRQRIGRLQAGPTGGKRLPPRLSHWVFGFRGTEQQWAPATTGSVLLAMEAQGLITTMTRLRARIALGR